MFENLRWLCFSQGFAVFRGKNSPCAESPKTAKGDQQSQRTEGMNTLSRIVLLFETSGDFDDGKNLLRDNCVTDFRFCTMDTGVKPSK